jgi:cytochrome b561
MTAESHDVFTRMLHWLSGVLVAVAWLVGEDARDTPWQFALHAGPGVAVIAITFPRLACRATHRRAPMPGPVWMEGAARLTHLALYALLLLVPALGMLATWLRGEAVPGLGLFSLSSPLTAERAMSRAVKGAHELAANLLIGLALAHVAAALFHQLVLRDGPLGRMRLPWRG